MGARYWTENGKLRCQHGVLLYGTKCVRCERGETLMAAVTSASVGPADHVLETPADDGPRVRAADEGQRKMMLELVNTAAMTFAPWRQHMMDSGASPNSDTLLASAVAMYAGAIMGELLGMGVLLPSDLDAALGTLAKNMRDGVKGGQAKVLRVTQQVMAEEQAEQGGSGVAS